MSEIEKAIWAAAFGWSQAWGHDLDTSWSRADAAVKAYREGCKARGVAMVGRTLV